MRIFLAALLAATALPALAQPSETARSPLFVTRPPDDIAWDITEDLTTEVGQRLAGTEAEARARAWSVRRLTELGFANVRVESSVCPSGARSGERRTARTLSAEADRRRARQ
jgi:hypothetical protein